MTPQELIDHQLVLRKKFSEFAWPKLHLYHPSSWFDMDQNVEEIRECCERIAAINPKCIIELGCGHAGTHVLFKGLAETVISVDHNQAYMVGNAFLIKEFYGDIGGSYFLWGDGKRQETAEHLEALMKQLGYEFADVLFADMHWNEPDLAKLQFTIYKEFIRPGGLVFVHQWNSDRHVRKFLTQYAEENSKLLVGIMAKTGFKPGIACMVM